MVDDRFSAEEFARAGLDTEAARELADMLQDEIANEMQVALETGVGSIVEKLNLMGHQLKLEATGLGEIAFRDDGENEAGYFCRLRVAGDLIISTGYAHLISASDEDGENRRRY